MGDSFHLAVGRRIKSKSGIWYRNLQVLGAGGNASTFLAIATSGPNRGIPFAIKFFRELSKPERRESFFREADFLKQCNHPSIMRIFDAGVFDNEHPFFVAEYLPDTLHEVIRSKKSLLTHKVSFALQLLSALAYLEQLSPAVVHRDIKPKNVFVKGRSCVLGDFGLLKHVDAVPPDEDERKVFKESAGPGMPFRYRSPDQVAYLKNEAPLTPKSDVFQLGLVLAELFFGSNPQKSARDFSQPVELEPLGNFEGPNCGPIKNLIQEMLEPNPVVRKGAGKFLVAWDGIFQRVWKEASSEKRGRKVW